MRNVTSCDRVAKQFRDAADAAQALARQEDEETVRSGESGASLLGPPSPQQGKNIAGGWPLRDFMELGALPGAVPCARLHARQLLWEWGLTGLTDNAELLVSELVTNAVQASCSVGQVFPVRLWLLADRARVLILIWDASPRPPVRMNISDDDESGRGLLLVEAISTKWDWYFPAETSGKVVWLCHGHGKGLLCRKGF
jgi:anti-sigma regulatory factor (Ser/Thr protein kinase)